MPFLRKNACGQLNYLELYMASVSGDFLKRFKKQLYIGGYAPINF